MWTGKWQVFKWSYDRFPDRKGTRRANLNYFEKFIALVILARPLVDSGVYFWTLLQRPIGGPILWVSSLVLWLAILFLDTWSNHESQGMLGILRFLHIGLINGWHLYWLYVYTPDLSYERVGVIFEYFWGRWLFLAVLFISVFGWAFLMTSLRGHRRLVIFYGSLYPVYGLGIESFTFSGNLQKLGLHIAITWLVSTVANIFYEKWKRKLRSGGLRCLTK